MQKVNKINIKNWKKKVILINWNSKKYPYSCKLIFIYVLSITKIRKAKYDKKVNKQTDKLKQPVY